MITLSSVIWLDMCVRENNIILPLHSYYFYSFIYCSVVEGRDDYCLDFLTFEGEYGIEYNIHRYENCLLVTLLGISAIQSELHKPDLALGTSEVSLWLGGGGIHVNIKYNIV